MSAQQAGEKTEKATPKKKRDAREKGQIIKSTEVVTAFCVLAMFAAVSVFGEMIIENTKKLMIEFFSAGNTIPSEMSFTWVGSVFSNVIIRFLIIMLPLLAVAFISAILFNVLQTGFFFSGKAMAPKMNRINMFSGFKRIFSKQTLFDLVKSLLKLTVLAFVAYDEYKLHLNESTQLMPQNVVFSAKWMADMLLGVAFKLCLALCILAPFDFLYQWWKHEKELMMTKQEVREEYKLTEGDPQIKGKIRQKQRQISSMRMMQAVSHADVVITNPTHYAVAIEYDESKSNAPVVVAKGKDYVAKKIREKAEEQKIEIVQNKPLAQSLYFFCDIGEEIPEDLYQAVAEILAYVYRLKEKMRGAR